MTSYVVMYMRSINKAKKKTIKKHKIWKITTYYFYVFIIINHHYKEKHWNMLLMYDEQRGKWKNWIRKIIIT